MNNTLERETLTVDEAAKVLGIGRNKAYEAVHTGDIPSLRFGNRIVIPRKSIDDVLNSTNYRRQE
jgi:excisionase family DNA binding protein